MNAATQIQTKPATPTKPANSLRQMFDRKLITISKSSKSFEINPFEVQIEEGFNPRDYGREDVEAHIEYLTQCIIAGIDLGEWKVIVRDGVVYVRDGHCRRLAVNRAAERGTVLKSVRVVECAGDEIAQVFEILGTNNGLKLNPIERASTYQRLINHGIKEDEIAAREKMTSVAIKQYLTVNSMPVELKKLIANNTMVMTLALELYRDFGTDAVAMVKNTIAHKAAQIEDQYQVALNKHAEKNPVSTEEENLDMFLSNLPVEDGVETVPSSAQEVAVSQEQAEAPVTVNEASPAPVTSPVALAVAQAAARAEKANTKPVKPQTPPPQKKPLAITKKDLVAAGQMAKEEKLSADEIRDIKHLLKKISGKVEEHMHLDTGNGVDINLDIETAEQLIKLVAKLK